ncbi:MAG: hypothetical protein ACPGYL_07665, partial [Rhodospirillaceae bacterium]
IGPLNATVRDWLVAAQSVLGILRRDKIRKGGWTAQAPARWIPDDPEAPLAIPRPDAATDASDAVMSLRTRTGEA